MKIEQQHIQPMKTSRLLSYMWAKGKDVFLVSLLGNLLLFIVFITITFIFFEHAISLGLDMNALNTLRMLNNVLIVSLSSVHIFYLLIGNDELTYIAKVKFALLKTINIIPTLIVATLLYAVFTSMGLALLLLPGILLFVYLGIYSQTIAFEDQGILSSLIRSRELVRGSFWKVCMILVFTLVITNLAVISLELILRMYLPAYPLWLDIGVYSITYMIMMPFVASIYALIYFDLRSRQEAFDYAVFSKERNEIIS